MLKILNGKNIFIASLILIVLIVAIILRNNLIHYYLANNYSDSYKNCNEKKIIWDRTIYPINTNPSGGKLVLKVQNRNKDFWSTMLDSVQSSQEEFKICSKSLIKLPVEIENSPNTPSEIKERSKGLELSIGIQEPFKYTPIGNLTFNIRLFSNKFNDDNYNLDVAVANIAENIFLTKESDSSWHISFKSLLEDKDIPFHYELVRINDKEIVPNDNIEFISKDNGKTWVQRK